MANVSIASVQAQLASAGFLRALTAPFSGQWDATTRAGYAEYARQHNQEQPLHARQPKLLVDVPEPMRSLLSSVTPPDPGNGATPVVVLSGVAAKLVEGTADTVLAESIGFSSLDGQTAYGTGSSSLPWQFASLYSHGPDLSSDIRGTTIAVDQDTYLGDDFTYCEVRVNGVKHGPFQFIKTNGRYGALHVPASLVLAPADSIEVSLFTAAFVEEGPLNWTFTAGNYQDQVYGYVSAAQVGDGSPAVGTITAGDANSLDNCYYVVGGGTIEVGLFTSLNNPSTSLKVTVNGGSPIDVPFTLFEGNVQGNVASATPLAVGDVVTVSFT